MKKLSLLVVLTMLLSLWAVPAVNAAEPATPQELFAAYLADFNTAPAFTQIGEDDTTQEGVIIRRGYFEYEELNGYSAYAVIAMPAEGNGLPGLVYYHGAGQTVEGNALPAAVRYARAGYVVIAPELYGIADHTAKSEHTDGMYDLGDDYDGSLYNMSGGAKGSSLYAAVGTGIEAYKILSKLENVDPARIGVSGVSYGGYMACMVSGLLGGKVKAAYALYGAGFFDQGTIFGDGMLTYDASIGVPESIATDDPALAAKWRSGWLATLDAGRVAGGITDLYVSAAANDTFFYPTSINATIEAAPNKNLNFSPNDSHSLVNTPHGEDLDVNYLNSKLKGGAAVPKIAVVNLFEDGSLKSVNAVVEGGTLAEGGSLDVRVWYSAPDKGWQDREWKSVLMNSYGSFYGVTMPDEAVSANCDWFVSAYDDAAAATSIVYRNLGVLQNQSSNTSVVKNGEFENNGASWLGGTWQPGGVNGSAGSYTAAQNVEQTIPLVAGQLYSFSTYVKVDAAVPFQALLLLDGSYQPAINHTEALSPGVWHKVEGQFTSKVTGDVRMFLTTNSPGTRFTVDNFRVKTASRAMYEVSTTPWAPIAPGYIFETAAEGGYYFDDAYTKATYTHVDGGNGWLRSNATLYGGVDYQVRFIYRGDAAAAAQVTGFDLLVLDQNGSVLKQYQVPAPTAEWQVFECKFSRGDDQGAGADLTQDQPTVNIFEFRPAGITGAGASPVGLELMPLSIQRSNNLLGNGDFEMGVAEGVNPIGFKLVDLTASVREGVGKEESLGLVMDSRGGGLARIKRNTVQYLPSFYGGVTYQVSGDFKALDGHSTAFAIMGDGWTNLLTNPDPAANLPASDGFTTYTGTFRPEADGTFGDFFAGMWGGDNIAHFVMDNLQILEPKVAADITPVEENPYIGGRIAVGYTFTQVSRFVEEESLYRISTSADGTDWSVVESGRCQANSGPVEYFPQAEDIGKFVRIDMIPRDERGALGDPATYTTPVKIVSAPLIYENGAATFTNLDEERSATLIVAVYQDGTLKDIALKTQTVPKGASVTLDGPAVENGETVKVMVFDSMETLVPLLPALTPLSKGGV